LKVCRVCYRSRVNYPGVAECRYESLTRLWQQRAFAKHPYPKIILRISNAALINGFIPRFPEAVQAKCPILSKPDLWQAQNAADLRGFENLGGLNPNLGGINLCLFIQHKGFEIRSRVGNCPPLPAYSEDYAIGRIATEPPS
jgi:hypothetical protein